MYLQRDVKTRAGGSGGRGGRGRRRDIRDITRYRVDDENITFESLAIVVQ